MIVMDSKISQRGGAPSYSRFLAASALFLLLTCCHVSPTRGSAFKVTDAYSPACGKLMTEPPAESFKRWSDWRTWGASAKVRGVPGTGARRWADVMIPCGKAVLLDVPDISVGKLRIRGWLKILDDPSLPKIHVRAAYIMVFGRLTAGEPDNHFSNRVTFTLFQNFKERRAPYALQFYKPSDPNNPRDLGHKTFAVVGGQVALYGMPGGGNTPSWVRLTETADAGARAIYVNADVTRWAPGMTIALASTSANLNDAEHHVIASVSVVTPVSGPGKSDGRYKINLQTALKKRHDGEKISDGVGGTVGIYGEVALLDRNIKITGSDEPAPYQYDGGNFMVYMTPTAQKIVGVQFRALGNQGVLGKYPLHFHVCGQKGANHVVRKNAIVFTKQRCMVIHATGNMTIEENVSYETKGHCYLLEEGSEMRNVFRRNLGINARKVDKVIPPLTSSRLDLQTDKQPTTFWLATPFSSFIDNVAAGSEDSGFWLEANPYMRGLSRLLPDIGSTVPFYYNWGTWDGNHAHSNALFGLRTYPHGSRPHYPSPTKNPRVSLKNFLVYRNKAGMFFFNSERLIVENGVFLDNGIGIDLSRNAGVQAKGCRFIGRTSSSCPSSNALATATALTTTTTTTTTATTTTTTTAGDASNGPDGSIPPADPLPDNNDTAATTPPNAPDNSTLPSNDSTGGDGGGDGDATAPSNPPDSSNSDSSVPQGPTTLWQPFTLEASLGPLDPISSSNKAFIGAGTAEPMGPSLQDQAGTFAAPIGIALSQSNPQDHLYPNSIQDSSFHRFGTCSSSSFGIALVANKAGGYWNTAMFIKVLPCSLSVISFICCPLFTPDPPFTQGLTFTAGTNKFWATPNPPAGTPPRGGLLARFYAIRDLDGSLLGQSGYAVANYDPILPPAAVRPAKCDFKSAFSAYSCTSVCYRAVGLEYDEYGARANTYRPFSYLKITRMDDGTFFHAYGTDNDDPNGKPASSTNRRRYLTASLLAGYTYRIQIIPADTNSDFYPSKMQLNVFDWQGCSGSVRVVIDSPDSRSKWRADVPTVPCTNANETKVYKEYACGDGKSRLRLDVGPNSSGKAAVVMELDQGVSTACSSDSGCSTITSAALPPLSIAPLADSESAFSSTDPFFDPSFYAGGADDPRTVL
ncbi:unnamed protein product [Closterium sp. Yama58-4]|nr:unnamed protein product [Closterium sp. Yama58-4]